MINHEEELYKLDISQWKDYILSIDDRVETRNYIDIGDLRLHFSLEELDLGMYPVRCGDILTHKKYGGRFIVYDYPFLDNRRVLGSMASDIKMYIIEDGQCYYVDGILDDGREAGTERTGKHDEYLTIEECNWKNFEYLSHVYDLDKNDPLYRVHIQCMYWYPYYEEMVEKDYNLKFDHTVPVIKKYERKKYPIRCGDIVTHKTNKGRFIVYDYPYQDIRKNIRYRNNVDDYISTKKEFYFVEGYYPPDVYETFSTIDVTPSRYLSEDDCYWENFRVISHVYDLKEDDFMYKIHQDCIKKYYRYKERVEQDYKESEDK